MLVFLTSPGCGVRNTCKGVKYFFYKFFPSNPKHIPYLAAKRGKGVQKLVMRYCQQTVFTN